MIKVINKSDRSANKASNFFPRLMYSPSSGATFLVTGRGYDDKFYGLVLEGTSMSGKTVRDSYSTFDGYNILHDYIGDLTISND